MKCHFPFLALLIVMASAFVSVIGQDKESNNSTVTPAQVSASRSGVTIPPEKAAPITIPKAAGTIVIDGRPDEEIWSSAAVFKDFVQTFPGDNTAASKPTEVFMLYDEHNLYIAFKCWDERDKVRASLAKRDDVFGEDNVRVYLDTYHDRRRAYILGFNPLGIQQDGIYTEGQGSDFSVDIIMESKGIIEDWGWSVEVKIPFKSLRYAAGNGKFWGFNAARNIDRFNDEMNQWLPDDRNIAGFLVKSGRITGLDDIKYERTLEVVPSITLSETGSRTRIFPTMAINSDRFVNGPLKQDIGVTLKYNFSPNITLDAAYNPDFAEIEADAAVVTANQRFPIFFEEKRPFFLEGADIFSTPYNLFNSRSIVDPDVAAKLTGKIGKTSFGVLVASDKAPGNYSPDERNDPDAQNRIREFLDRNATVGILRVKRDVGAENSVGFLGTYRNFPEQRNFVGSFDAKFKLTPRLVTQFQLIGTYSKSCFFQPAFEPANDHAQARLNREICGTGTFDPKNDGSDGSLDSNSFTYRQYKGGTGVGYYASADYTTDLHGWFAEAGGRSRDYRADAGFTRQTNTNFAFFYNRFNTKSKPNAKIIRAKWAQFSSIDYDWEGRIQKFNIGTNANIDLQRSTFISVEAGTSFSKIYEDEFGLKRMPTRHIGTFSGLPYRSAWQRYVSGSLDQTFNKNVTWGFWAGYTESAFDYFYFDKDGLQNPGAGKLLNAEAWLEYKPFDSLRMSSSYIKSRMVRNDNRVRTFDSDIVSFKSTYQFSRFVFTRIRVDYDSMSRNTSGQALFGWTPSPGKAFYVGYNDDFNYNGFNPYTGIREPGFERNGRTFFIRASYLFRKSF